MIKAVLYEYDEDNDFVCVSKNYTITDETETHYLIKKIGGKNSYKVHKMFEQNKTTFNLLNKTFLISLDHQLTLSEALALNSFFNNQIQKLN